MDKAARCAFVHAQAACAMAAVAAMQAKNQLDLARGAVPRYLEEDFRNVESNYCIGHNSVIDFLRD